MVSHRLFFIHNPNAGNASQQEKARSIMRSVKSRFVWSETNGPRNATLLVQQAVTDRAEIVVAVGGDGTVHEILNGLMEINERFRPALGILPLGSGNDFAYAVGLPRDPIDALGLLWKANFHRVDVGRIQDSNGAESYWINSCGVGLNAHIALRAKSSRLHGFLKYFVASLQEIWSKGSSPELELEINSERSAKRITLLTVGNGPREGGGFLMTPDAKIDDGYFDLLSVDDLTRFQLLRLLPKAKSGGHLRSSGVSLQRCSSINIRSEEPLIVHLDGEIFAEPSDNVRELSATILPGAIRIIA